MKSGKTLGKPVVVGVDGSPESVRAAALAWRIAQAMHVRIYLVCALPDPGPVNAFGPPVYGPELFERLDAETRRAVMDTLRAELPPGVVETLDVRVGRPAAVLAQIAAKVGAGVVVVGGRHHGAIARGLGGSTAHTLVRTLGVPVLVAGPGAPALERVLAAVDLSEAAAPTFAVAAEYARLLDARLRVLHVVEPIRFPVVVPLTVDPSEFERRSTAAFEDVLRGVGGSDGVDRLVRSGTAVEAIATEAVAGSAGLLVIGSHGKNWIDRMMIGSTAERLLNLLPVSLLVVPIEALVPRGARRAPTRRRRPRTRKGVRT